MGLRSRRNLVRGKACGRDRPLSDEQRKEVQCAKHVMVLCSGNRPDVFGSFVGCRPQLWLYNYLRSSELNSI